jgi:hypothetical protein
VRFCPNSDQFLPERQTTTIKPARLAKKFQKQDRNLKEINEKLMK